MGKFRKYITKIFLIALVLGYSIFTIQTNNDYSTLEKYGTYKNCKCGLIPWDNKFLVTGYGEFAVLINNLSAHDPTWQEAINFIIKDKIDENLWVGCVGFTQPDQVNIPYIRNWIDTQTNANIPLYCIDFAEQFHNHAEFAGLRCGVVLMETGYSFHIINCFNTTDRGILYVDCCGKMEIERLQDGFVGADKLVDTMKIGEYYLPHYLFGDYKQQTYSKILKMDIVWSGVWVKF
jgi:hypothetical protein